MNLCPSVQFVQEVPIVQPPPFSSPAGAGEDRGGGFNGLNDLNVFNAMCQSACALDHTMSAFNKIQAGAKQKDNKWVSVR